VLNGRHGEVSEPRVISTASVGPRAETKFASETPAYRCLGCGYHLGDLPGSTPACPECGRPIDVTRTDDPIGPVDGSEGVAVARGVTLVFAGLVLTIAPGVGALAETIGWWRVTVGPGAGRRSAPVLRWSIRGLSLAAALSQALMWIVLADVYWLRFWVTNTVADDAAAGVAVSAALVVWTVRHAVGCVWLARLGRRACVPAVTGLAISSGLGAVGATGSGFLLIGLGVFISHLALFPPLCFLLPLWAAAVAGWVLISGVMAHRVRGAMLGDG
jgi:hypothetical protein